MSASNLWKAFLNFELSVPSLNNVVDETRHHCALGFLALDASLKEYLKNEVVPDWQSRVCLIQATLFDSNELKELSALSNGPFHILFWKKTLGVLALCRDIESKKDLRISDIAALMLIEGGFWRSNEARKQHVLALFRLQELRNDCLELNGAFCAKRAQEALKYLREFREGAIKFSPYFSITTDENFSEEKAKAA